ncbi:MAG: hypothetical protein AAF657_38635, partial [Acidobacteriota bacterium]
MKPTAESRRLDRWLVLVLLLGQAHGLGGQQHPPDGARDAVEEEVGLQIETLIRLSESHRQSHPTLALSYA